jgi:hypothetical protein
MGWTTRLLERIKELRWAPAALLLLGLLMGCANHQANRDSHIARAAGSSGALPEPNGAFTRRIIEAQAEKAEASDFVVSLDEWTSDGVELGPHGQRHLAAMARRLGTVSYPVVLEPGFDPAVNDTRRQVLVTALARNGVPDADARVIIAYPQAEWLYGDEAPLIYNNMIYSGQGRGLYNGLYNGRYGLNGYRNNLGYGGYFGSYGLGWGGGAFGLFGY